MGVSRNTYSWWVRARAVGVIAGAIALSGCLDFHSRSTCGFANQSACALTADGGVGLSLTGAFTAGASPTLTNNGLSISGSFTSGSSPKASSSATGGAALSIEGAFR
jgi:hypothetical protein